MSTSSIHPVLTDPEMKEIVDSFLIESKEILEKLEIDLVKMENNPDDTELLNDIFRSFHTIKGAAGFLSLTKLTSITHKGEDILNKLRKKEAILNNEIMEVILLSSDKLKELLNCIEENQNEECYIDDVLEKLSVVAEKLEENKSENIQTEKIEILPGDIEIAKKSDNNISKKENTIRVDVERLDELLNIASELVLGRNRLSQVYSQIASEFEGTNYARDLGDAAKLIDLRTNELQLVVMKTRMVKIGKIFNRFPRVVRDLCKDSDKEVQLKIDGEDTELDKSLIEEINDPLTHLIRNSLDHGIETLEDRLAAGKNPIGAVNLSAYHEGNNIVISVKDDGKGIDPEKIIAKAITKGLISKEKSKELSQQEVFALIFLPGFSTAEVVTNISGRGVGMDVVKTNVTKLRGIINVISESGKGTEIIIKLPLTLAIIPGMIVKVDTETLVIPLNSVIEVVRTHSENIPTINGNEVIKLRDDIIPLIEIDKLVFNKDIRQNKNIWQYIVIVGIAEKRFGIKVDELIGQKEVVVKSLGNYLGAVNGIAGSTILGDGTVVMILDISELLNKHTSKNAG
jgi:two-component system, chemotaxis family, sensor kinase CheA